MAKMHLARLNHDLISMILARVDGPSLAAATCACSDLRKVAQEEKLWKDLCCKTWPSTLDEKVEGLISSAGGFSKFYATSFPLIVYSPIQGKSLVPEAPELDTHVSPSNFVSLIDVYYKKKCIFSKVLFGIPGPDAGNENRDGGSLGGPFTLVALGGRNANRTLNDYDNITDDDDYEDEDVLMSAQLPSVTLLLEKERGWRWKLCKKLEENVRLSWVILDKYTGKAVNLSSWKPLSVKSWVLGSDFVMRFGCIVPITEDLVGSKSAECVILMKCMIMETRERFIWKEILLQIEDIKGGRIDRRRSTIVLQKALSCERSRNRREAARGYEKYVKEKKEMKENRIKSNFVVEGIHVFAGIAAALAVLFFISLVFGFKH